VGDLQDEAACEADAVIISGNAKVNVWGTGFSFSSLSINDGPEHGPEDDLIMLAVSDGQNWIPVTRVLDYFWEQYPAMLREALQEQKWDEEHEAEISSLEQMGRV